MAKPTGGLTPESLTDALSAQELEQLATLGAHVQAAQGAAVDAEPYDAENDPEIIDLGVALGVRNPDGSWVEDLGEHHVVVSFHLLHVYTQLGSLALDFINDDELPETLRERYKTEIFKVISEYGLLNPGDFNIQPFTKDDVVDAMRGLAALPENQENPEYDALTELLNELSNEESDEDFEVEMFDET